MPVLKKSLLAMMCLHVAAPAFAAPKSASPKPARPVAQVPEAERYTRRCQSHAPERNTHPQGTLLWGTSRQEPADEYSSVLVSLDLGGLRQGDAGVKALRLESGHLVAAAASPAKETLPASSGVVGSVLRGTASDGKPVEVAICGAEPAAEDPGMVWYRVESWNPATQRWENPCVATSRVPDPRALAVGGVWDTSGAHRDAPGKLTFACENGAITKCIRWGYKPWTNRDGHSLADLHQACTRMARADYCGNGRSHTHEDTAIDMYDRLGVLSRATETTGDWDPARASFEAAWAPDGASCMARTRDGRELAKILEECPERFQKDSPVDLGNGDSCAVRRAGASLEPALLRNRSYGGKPGSATKVESK